MEEQKEQRLSQEEEKYKKGPQGSVRIGYVSFSIAQKSFEVFESSLVVVLCGQERGPISDGGGKSGVNGGWGWMGVTSPLLVNRVIHQSAHAGPHHSSNIRL